MAMVYTTQCGLETPKNWVNIGSGNSLFDAATITETNVDLSSRELLWRVTSPEVLMDFAVTCIRKFHLKSKKKHLKSTKYCHISRGPMC